MRNRLLLFVFLSGLALNISGYFFADYIKNFAQLPLFLDSTGTILAGVILGPIIGGLTGFTSNLILGVVHNPVNIPFSIVNILIGIAAGLTAKRYGFRDIKSLLILVGAITAVSALGGAIVAFFVFGGVTGAKIDLNIIAIMNAGYKLFTSSFIVRIPANLLDKGISALAAFIIIRKLKPEFRGFAEKGNDSQD